ncbi:DUF2163 domain-containing protein [Ancylobacter terrae]|uniref:DUF2163 domain-containing protein n=1 Tax=Ancylobacter sp. sgz301288 TaxID=3342077 RepID=UPI00385B3B62
MRALPEGLAAALAGGVTTLARCWRITRTDGVVIGVTDHDGDLVVDGTLFRAAGGVAGSEETASLGFAVDGSELSAALTADILDEDALAAGLFDGAGVDLLLADWSAPADFLALRRFRLGEVRREGGAFVAELRGPADRLNEIRGRLFTSACAADLGDARCRIDLAAPAYRATGTVETVEAAGLFTVTGLEAFADGHFSRGRLLFEDGANAGFASEVKAHGLADGAVRLTLWQRPPQLVAAGAAFTVTAGCDKRFSTCRDRFANALNFRGFPHMPGNDAVMRVAIPGGEG